MKIGIVSATYRPSRNGVVTSTALFVRGLRELGHEVRVFAPAYPGAAPEEGVYRLPSLTLGAVKDYPVLLPVTVRQARRLPLGDLDLVHTMHPFVAGRTALRWAQRLRRPLVFTAHTQYHTYAHYAPAPEGVARWAIRRHVRTFASRADLVLAPGQTMLDVLRDYGYGGEVTVLANPIDRCRFVGVDASWVRPRFAIPERVPLLVFVGRLAPEKNLELLLGAFREVAQAAPEARLLVIGDGPSRAALEARAVGAAVHFLGSVDNAALPPYLVAADVFVTASVSETGSPLAHLEALAAGTPVVTVEGAGADEVVIEGVNGLSCEPTEAALGRAVLELLRDRQALERFQKGALESVKAFDVARQARALERHYLRVLGRSRRGSPRGGRL